MFGLEQIADGLDRLLDEAQRGYDAKLADTGRRAGDYFGVDSGWTTATAIPAGIAWAIASTVVLVEKGFVDVLRYGEGSKQGNAGGYAQDGLRLLSILPVVGAAGRGLGSVGRASAAARTLQVAGQGGGMACGPQVIVNAGLLSGQATRLTVAEVGVTLGKGSPNAGMFYEEIRNMLHTYGIANREIVIADEGLQAVEAVAAQNNGPVIFGVRWWTPGPTGIVGPATRPRFNTQTGRPYLEQMNAGRPMAQAADHWLLAFKGADGRIMVADQYGARPIAELGTIQGAQTQFTMANRLLQVHQASVLPPAGAARAQVAYEALGSPSQTARSAQWIARSLALEMVVVDGPTTQRIDSAIREKVGRPPRDGAMASGKGSGGGASGGSPLVLQDTAPATTPMPNSLSTTYMQDTTLILAKMPRNGDTIEFNELLVQTNLPSPRLRDGLLWLLKGGLAAATRWGTVDGKDTPAMVRRTTSR